MKKRAILIFIISIISCSLFAQQKESKPIAAVLDLTPIEVAQAEATAITNLLTSAIHGTGLVQMIDRSQREEILNEIAFSVSGCADESCAIEIGQMLAADLLITGSLSKVGSRISIELKALDVAEGAIIETTFKLYNSIDEVVDNIDSIGANLMQNITGKRAAQREVLEYEDLVTLTVISDIEGAAVIINDSPVGRIIDGKLTKALNRNIDAMVRLEHPRYYTQESGVFLESDKSITIEMMPYYPVTGALKIGSGAGSMFSVLGRWFPVPNRFFMDFGLATTIQNMNEFYMKELMVFKSGYYFNDENNFIRPYGGVAVMYPLFDWLIDENFPGPIAFFSSNPDDDNQSIATGSDSLLEALDFGIMLGLDFAFTKNFYLGIEADLMLNSLFQTSNFSFRNLFLKPFKFSDDPMFQFGVNSTFQFEPAFRSNNPEAIKTEGRKIIWNYSEYKPVFWDAHLAFIDDMRALPHLEESIQQEIDKWWAGEVAWAMTGLGMGVVSAGFGGWAIYSVATENYETASRTGVTSLAAGICSIIAFITHETMSMPRNVINEYNRLLEVAE